MKKYVAGEAQLGDPSVFEREKYIYDWYQNNIIYVKIK